jgi:hypothetical protein
MNNAYSESLLHYNERENKTATTRKIQGRVAKLGITEQNYNILYIL